MSQTICVCSCNTYKDSFIQAIYIQTGLAAGYDLDDLHSLIVPRSRSAANDFGEGKPHPRVELPCRVIAPLPSPGEDTSPEPGATGRSDLMLNTRSPIVLPFI